MGLLTKKLLKDGRGPQLRHMVDRSIDAHKRGEQREVSFAEAIVGGKAETYLSCQLGWQGHGAGSLRRTNQALKSEGHNHILPPQGAITTNLQMSLPVEIANYSSDEAQERYINRS